LKKEKNKVADIVLFGSSVKGKEFYRDIDIGVVFSYSADKRIIQEIKSIDPILHVDFVLLTELFSHGLWKTFFREGISIKTGKKISEVFGLSPFGLFTYSLRNLKNKSRFSQVMGGYKSTSMVKEAGGSVLKPGVILVPMEKIELFREFLEQWDVEYNVKIVYME